jgi:hypothetical protein
MRRIASFVLVVLLASCVTPTTRGGSYVRLTQNPMATQGGEFLGNVGAVDIWSIDGAVATIRNEAAAMGGDLIFVTYAGPNSQGFAAVTGEVYRMGGTR